MSDPYKSIHPFKKFLLTIVGLVKAFLISIGLFVVLTPIILAIILSRYTEYGATKQALMTAPAVDPFALSLRLDGEISDATPGLEEELVERFLGGERRVYLPDLRLALRRAAKDDRIKGVHIEIGQIATSYATISELRRIFKKFKDSGKQLSFWLATADNPSYYLASLGDDVNLSPAGDISIPGPVFQLIYGGEAFRKIGVEFEVVRSGKYKSLFEPFVSNQPSPATLEMYGTMEESLRGLMVADVAATRGKSVDVVRAWFKQSLYTPVVAKAEGLIDDVSFLDEHKAAFLKRLKGDKKAEYTDLIDYIDLSEKIEAKDLGEGADGIGLIDAAGEIVMSGNSPGDEMITPLSMREQVEWAMDEKKVKAVVLRIDSPGGSATASDMIWRDIVRLKRKKPVVVSMGGVAASGGYYIAAPASKIIAEPTTFTGSIGVIGALPDFSAFKDKYGVSFHVITQSDRAKLLNPGERATSFDLAIMETGIAEIYRTFLSRVAEGRGMTVERADELGQGRVYTGAQALQLGLVDDLGGIDEAFTLAKELGGLKPGKLYPVLHYESGRMRLSECLKSLTNFMQCFGELHTATLVRTVTDKYAHNPAARWLKRLAAMQTALVKEKYLAIWPNYLSF